MHPAVVETVTSLALAIDAKDQYTQGHSQKVSAYAVVIAQALGMNDERKWKRFGSRGCCTTSARWAFRKPY